MFSLVNHTYFNRTIKTAPLAVFRVLFGVMMLLSIIRFWANGWISKLYLEPEFHFSYYGFEWVKPMGVWTYLLFVVCGLAALGVALGYKYRLSIVLFFLSFTYIELMDKTTYLNHYYFVSVLSFLMIFLPANRWFALDALKPGFAAKEVPRWTVDSLKLMLGIVYFYAGLAKLNSDWLVEAMPLKIWLPAKYDLPLLGDLMQQEWVHYAFSYGGAIYDLFIPFLLLFARTRWFAFGLVVIFHVLTRVLFPIGMFPYIMIVSSLIFFSPSFHERLLSGFQTLLKRLKLYRQQAVHTTNAWRPKTYVKPVLILFFAVQLLFPWRYLLYPGELFWTEEGYRFSWRVMLMEKAGYAQFKVVDGQSGKSFAIDNSDFLTPLQEKQMSFQPDFILEYAHYLADHYQQQGYKDVAVYVESYVALNGRLSQAYIDPKVDLVSQRESFKHKTWILPFNDTIDGL
ncbi:HTTM domain-containing protein [Gilvibacter sp. SZ-19]|uniref:HTTM domain-containing protein n=1 Tax=Gilvibacter sp. SZ-19 TaxID=754429 RepID=UPI000B3BEA4C|nr:HTTM domain-containing protein [Gilvibacter sp. SZ-19]ARV12853.1 HTTM domain-containing protein [Gilvibacter sp. SZ-19]